MGVSWFMWVWLGAFTVAVFLIGDLSKKFARVYPRYRRVQWFVFFPACLVAAFLLLVVVAAGVQR